MKNPDVVLVAPPTDLIGTPSLAVGILKAGLQQRHIPCKAIYPNRMFAEALGWDLYEELSKGRLNNLIIECLFAPVAHESLPAIRAEDLRGAEWPPELREYHRTLGTLDTHISDSLLREGQERCARFVRTCVEGIVRLRPKILGFSNSFMTTNAAIAIGKEVKKSLPDVLYVVGGSNCQGPMGEALAESVPSIDVVFQGDADEVFPAFCEDYLRHGRRPPGKLIRCRPTQDLDALPIPEYGDFFDQAGEDQQSATLPFEGSRGCWWGQKRRCSFCGEAEGDLHYRVKSPERALRELFRLKALYPGVGTYFSADALFPDAYFEEVLPTLVRERFDKKLICETRAHLTPRQISLMKRCGMDRILVGIETLSTRLLHILHKGTDALTNVRLLRNCVEGGVSVSWLLMTGIPGDRAEDYETQLRLLPWIEHLMPPAIDPLRLQRFSPFFDEPERYGIVAVQPISAYRYAFPEGMDRGRLAYYFTAEYPSDALRDPELMSRFIDRVKRWQSRWQTEPVPELSLRRDGETWQVKDTRSRAASEFRVLDMEELALLRRCREGLPAGRVTPNDSVRGLLESGYLLEIDGRLLSVVCEPAL